jgi:hypothetical protein
MVMVMIVIVVMMVVVMIVMIMVVVMPVIVVVMRLGQPVLLSLPGSPEHPECGPENNYRRDKLQPGLTAWTVNALLIYIPPSAISHTTAVCDSVAASPSITACLIVPLIAIIKAAIIVLNAPVPDRATPQ